MCVINPFFCVNKSKYQTILFLSTTPLKPYWYLKTPPLRSKIPIFTPHNQETIRNRLIWISNENGKTNNEPEAKVMRTRVAMNFRCRKKWEELANQKEHLRWSIKKFCRSNGPNTLPCVRYIGVLYVGTRVIVEKYDSKKWQHKRNWRVRIYWRRVRN